MEQALEMQIWEVIDGMASETTLAAHEKALSENIAYAQLYAELLSLHYMLQEMPLETPSMRFASNVMDRVMAQQAIKTTADSGVYLFLALMLLLTTLTSIFLWFMPLLPKSAWPNTDWVAQADTAAWLPIGLIINVLLLFIFVDKYYLKPYFDKTFRQF